MDFMNLNQSAHGDREFGFIGSRMRLNRKIVVGHWEDPEVIEQIAVWTRVAAAFDDAWNMKVARFGDNMRDVAVTEGNKLSAQIQMGYSVNGYGIGDLVAVVNTVDESQIKKLIEEYKNSYHVAQSVEESEALWDAARIEAGMTRFLEDGKFKAFTTTFEDLHGLKQLPGLAVQRLMEKGYGFGAEGDWKTAALVRTMKVMASGLPGGTTFMEDYTYHLEKENELSLGAHMLEICPSITTEKAKIEVHELGIGGKEPPARLVFEGHQGSAILASLVDMGGRVRLIVNEIEVVKPIYRMPNLPVARVMWKPQPDLNQASHLWMLAGGAHHAVLSYDATAEMLEDWCEIMGIEFVHINNQTTVSSMKQQLFLADLAWKLQ